MYNYYLSDQLGTLRQQELIQQAEERRLENQSNAHATTRASSKVQHDHLPRRLIHLLNNLLH